MTGCSKANPIFLSVLLLIGSLGTFVLPQSFRMPGGIYEHSRTFTYSEILSESNPTLQIEFEGNELRAEISQLMTNNTPITLLVYSENKQTIIQMHNVTQLTGESLVIDTPPREKWFLNVTRQNSDTEISLTVLKWYRVAIDFLIAYNPTPFLFCCVMLLYAIQRLYKLDKNCGIQIGFTLWDKKQGPLLIIVLILIGAALATPLAAGILRRDFEIIEHKEITEQSFSINESVNSIQLDLFEGEVFRFRIQLVTPHILSIGLILHRSDNTQQFTLVNLSNPILWRLDIVAVNDSDLALEIIGIDRDVNIEASLEIQRTWLGPRMDVVMPAVLAVLSCMLFIYAFVVTRHVHLLLRRRVDNLEEA